MNVQKVALLLLIIFNSSDKVSISVYKFKRFLRHKFNNGEIIVSRKVVEDIFSTTFFVYTLKLRGGKSSTLSFSEISK